MTTALPVLHQITELSFPGLRVVESDASAAGCLLSVCAFFGIEPHGGGPFEQLLEQGDDTSPDCFVAAAHDLGLHASAHADLPVESLTANIKAGKPVVTDLGNGVWVVAYGVSAAGVLVCDPQRGQSVIPFGDWPNWGIVLDSPDAERREETIDVPGDPHYHLADHYSRVWNALHDVGETVPHWELNGAHENLAGTDWYTDLCHDGTWRPMHHEDMQRVYLWPAVEKGHGVSVDKARRRKVDPQQGLFGQWEDVNKQPERKTPQSSTAFEGMNPRRGKGPKGGQFHKISTGYAPGQQQLFGGEWQHRNTGGVTIVGEMPNAEFERQHPRHGKGPHGGEFAPKGEGALEQQNALAHEEEAVNNALLSAGDHPQARETRERKLGEERGEGAPPPQPVPEPTDAETPVDLSRHAGDDVNVHEELKQEQAEESHGKPAATSEPEGQRLGEAGTVSQPERRGDTSGGAGGDSGGTQPPSSGPRIVTARSEHTQAADPELVPESVRGYLNEAQRQGTALAINAMTKHGGFLLADGTGVGKTRQQIAVAQHFLEQGRKVVIVSPAEVIKPDWKKGVLSGSFASDSAVMGVPVKLTKGDGQLAPDAVSITTYNELGKLKNQIDKNTVVIFDESHFMKNRESARFKHGNEIMEKAAAVMYATATPGDKPLHIAHLARAGVFGNVGKTETYLKLGMRLVDQRVYGGNTIKVWQIDPHVGYKEAARRLSGLFDQMTADGLMIKRELAMDDVQFRADRVALSEGEHEAVAEVYAQKLKDTASKAFPNGNKAAALMAARMAQEPYKIPATVALVTKEMGEGRSPIVFLGRVNDISADDEEHGEDDGEEAAEMSYGTAGKLKEALVAAGIPASDIGELHGAATKTPDAKKKAMEKFQVGKTRVMIATVQSGGTGINLDDTTGAHPRTVIVMTPPFTANDMAQAIGRVHRLNTKSDSRIRGILADTHIDDWNAGILERKFQILGAVVQGEATRGQAAYASPEGMDEEENRKPFVWGESLKPQPKVYHDTPRAHNDIIGNFGGRRVNRNGEWTTQFPSKEHFDRYRAHVTPGVGETSRAPAPTPPSSSTAAPTLPIAIRRQKTSRGERSLYSFSPGNSFWDARKAGQVPNNVTVRKDPRSGRWEASIWGDNDKEIHDTVEQLLKAGVRL